MSEDTQQDPVFGSGEGEDVNSVIYFQFWGIKIRRRLKQPKPDLDPLEVVRKLLDDFSEEQNITKSRRVVHIHRIIENTHARRRLEKWSLRVIATYLFIVLLIVIATYGTFMDTPLLNIPPNIMIAILTTTTANIIGLGLIVLRGHFLAKDDIKREEGDE